MKDAISLCRPDDADFLSSNRAVPVCGHWSIVRRAMKAFVLAACVASVPCLADDGIPWITLHVVDTGVSLAVLQSSPRHG